MAMKFYQNFLDSIACTPKQHYDSLNQATIDKFWDDTDRIYTIKEQTAFPFLNEFTEYEAWLGSVSDNNINMNKSVSDFIQVWFKDNNHKINYKGQFYKLNLDNEHEETYICYDKMNPLSQTANFKIVRCNQLLTWIDSQTGDIRTMPCYIGYDLSSTNNQYGKDGAIPNARLIIYTQANEYTKSIVENQRFMFEHSKCFKVEQVEQYEWEQFSNNEITFIKLYIAYSPLLATDNKELNVCDYYLYDYNIEINETNPIKQVNGFSKKLTTTIYKNDVIVKDLKTIWKTSDENVVTIDEDGTMTIVGSVGDTAEIRAYIEGNDDKFASITVNVIEEEEHEVLIRIIPELEKLKLLEEQSQEFVCGVYDNGVKIDKTVTCSPSWTGMNYTLEQTSNGYKITNNNKSTKPLYLTFSADGLTDVIVKITLGGMI